MNRKLKQLLAALATSVAGAAQGAESSAVPPLPLPGPYAVECSNVAQDYSRLASGEDVQLYWDGVPRANGTPRNAADLLSDPANTPSVTVKAPNDSGIFGGFAGRSIPYVVVICHPTNPGNQRPDYSLPTGRWVPHMQRGGEAPLWPDATTRYPVLLFSHGYRSSPLSNDHLYAMTVFASFGYVVAAPFHADAAFSDLELDDIGDVFYLLTHLENFLAMQALRPLALSATLDLVLAQPQWRDRVDAAQIGGFGASMGAESLLLMAGGGLTTSIGQSWTQIAKDTRLKAAATYIPYFGQPGLPAFGRGQRGLEQITLSFLAISGTSDILAPIPLALEGVARLAGPRELVALTGVEHGYDVASTNDIFTWSLTYLDAEVRGDPVARAKLSRMTSVTGGGDDHVLIPFNGTAPGVPASTNFGGLWWNAPAESESGWGINFAHQGDVIFATWMTYDLAGKPWWLSMSAFNAGGNTFAGTLYEGQGPAFNAKPFDPRLVTYREVGTGTLTFSDSDSGSFAYVVNGVAQTKIITRQKFANPVPVCTFGATSDLASATNYQDMWWNAPADSEPGWGINLSHQGDVIFAVWFTYGQDGAPLWLSATLAKAAGPAYAGTLFRTTGPAFSATPFDRRIVSRTPVGSATLTFTNGNSGIFSYSVDGIAQSKAITRLVFRAPGTVCQ